MMTDTELIKLIDELRSLPKETEWVEFKENNSDPQEIGEYLSALSNSACLHGKSHAYLVFGIENQTQNVIGTHFLPTQRKIGNQELENWLATQLEPPIDFEISEFDYKENCHIALFKVDVTTNIPVKFRGVEYIRVGSYKKNLKDHPEKARKIWNKSQVKEFESGVTKKDLSADEILKLLDYSSYFRLTNSSLPTNKEAILQKLLEEKFLLKTSIEYSITNLGAILFAHDLTLFENLFRKILRVIIYKGKDRLATIKEIQFKKGYAISFEEIVLYINDQLPSNEEIGKAFRKEVKIYPEIAIRELVANALIHQDFFKKGTGPVVEIFEDRIEISNPGEPLIDPLRFIDNHPQSRNEKLAFFARRINICEERGSGVDKVVAAAELFQLPAPDFIEEDSFVKAILFSNRTLRQMDRKDKIRACYQHCCLRFVSNDLMSNQSLRERLGIPEENYSIVSRIIADTIEEKLIKDYDPENKSKRYAKYIPFWA